LQIYDNAKRIDDFEALAIVLSGQMMGVGGSGGDVEPKFGD